MSTVLNEVTNTTRCRPNNIESIIPDNFKKKLSNMAIIFECLQNITKKKIKDQNHFFVNTMYDYSKKNEKI